jgi:hypothetical protein
VRSVSVCVGLCVWVSCAWRRRVCGLVRVGVLCVWVSCAWHKRARVLVRVGVFLYVGQRSYVHTYMHTYTHVHTYIHTHTYKQHTSIHPSIHPSSHTHTHSRHSPALPEGPRLLSGRAPRRGAQPCIHPSIPSIHPSIKPIHPSIHPSIHTHTQALTSQPSSPRRATTSVWQSAEAWCKAVRPSLSTASRSAPTRKTHIDTY